MRHFFLIAFSFSFFFFQNIAAQDAEYKVACIGFYNLENLFDTVDDPDKRDEEFTPNGRRNWSDKFYQDKLHNLAKVVSQMGTELTPDGVALLGVSEVENRKVLEDLVKQPAIAGRNYQIVHYDSPDERGIDVALIYQPKYFTVTGSRPIPLFIKNSDGSRNFTRDVLHVSGILDGEEIHVLVNHWPSRSGGEKRSRPGRNAAAALCKQVKDSLQQIDPNVKIIIMGDLNDDPVSPSVKEVLGAKAKKKNVKEGDMFNPMTKYFKKGIGTTAWRDAWSLFDQVMVSYGLVKKDQPGYRFYKATVFNKPFLIQKTGRYKGYPFRTFDFSNYIAGYSDHFPVYLFLIKEVAGPKP
ncbi:MAG TPA: hypothetical protein ENJ95_19580 [Bacteroidetes bacterium]|nr:hypothetical protein [Bacteroidota bacterium]